MNITSKGRYALQVMLDLAQHREEGYISLKTVADRQGYSMKYLEMIVGQLKKAAEMNFRDYEDALQNVCVERMKADYIITRNKRDFAGSKVPAFSPEEFLEIDAPVNTC